MIHHLWKVAVQSILCTWYVQNCNTGEFAWEESAWYYFMSQFCFDVMHVWQDTSHHWNIIKRYVQCIQNDYDWKYLKMKYRTLKLSEGDPLRWKKKRNPKHDLISNWTVFHCPMKWWELVIKSKSARDAHLCHTRKIIKLIQLVSNLLFLVLPQNC